MNHRAPEHQRRFYVFAISRQSRDRSFLPEQNTDWTQRCGMLIHKMSSRVSARFGWPGGSHCAEIPAVLYAAMLYL